MNANDKPHTATSDTTNSNHHDNNIDNNDNSNNARDQGTSVLLVFVVIS